MDFFLQAGCPTNRLGYQGESRTFLDAYVHKGCTTLEIIPAETWRQARDIVRQEFFE